MKLLRDVWGFLQKERGWGLLLVFLVAVYSSHSLWSGGRQPEPRSEALEQLRVAEMRIKEEIRSAGGVQTYLAEKPKLLVVFNVFSLVLGVGILAGLALDFLWLFRPKWRLGIAVPRGGKANPRWGLSAILKVILIFVFVSLSLSLAFSLMKATLWPGLNSNLLVLIHTTLSDVVCLGLVVCFIRRAGNPWRALGFQRVHLFKDVGLGLGGYVAILPLFSLVLVLLAFLVHVFAYEPPPHPLVEIFLEEERRAPALIAYSVFLACVAGPIFEEIFFRGFCYPALRRRWGVGWGLVLTAAFFGFIHQNSFAFLPIFVLGLGLGYLYEKRGTLLPSITLHVVHNSVFIAYFFLAKEVLLRNSG